MVKPRSAAGHLEHISAVCAEASANPRGRTDWFLKRHARQRILILDVDVCLPARASGRAEKDASRGALPDCRSRALSLTPRRTGVVPRFRSFPKKTTTTTTCERRETKVCDQMRRYETSFGGFSSFFLTALMFFSCETLVIQSEVQVFPRTRSLPGGVHESVLLLRGVCELGRCGYGTRT